MASQTQLTAPGSQAPRATVALRSEHIAAIDALDAGNRVGGDPRTFSLSQIR